MKTDTSSPVILIYRTRGQIAKWALRKNQLRAWEAVYPRLDVLHECEKAWTWVEASPERRKTARGMPRFLVGWLNRAEREPQIPVRRPAARVPSTRAAWRDECAAASHVPQCSTWSSHELRCAVQEAGCQHHGVCQTFGECKRAH